MLISGSVEPKGLSADSVDVQTIWRKCAIRPASHFYRLPIRRFEVDKGQGSKDNQIDQFRIPYLLHRPDKDLCKVIGAD